MPIDVNGTVSILFIGAKPLNKAMKTIDEIRRDWIEELVRRFGSIAALNEEHPPAAWRVFFLLNNWLGAIA